jgi:hypothetical protein
VGDFNGDSYLDLASSNRGTGDTSVSLGSGQGGFAGSEAFATNVAPSALIAADIDGDGRKDLVVTSDNNNVSVLRGTDIRWTFGYFAYYS